MSILNHMTDASEFQFNVKEARCKNVVYHTICRLLQDLSPFLFIVAVCFMLRFYGRVFRAPILYSAHRAVIFAIAQLSCCFYICCFIAGFGSKTRLA